MESIIIKLLKVLWRHIGEGGKNWNVYKMEWNVDKWRETKVLFPQVLTDN